MAITVQQIRPGMFCVRFPSLAPSLSSATKTAASTEGDTEENVNEKFTLSSGPLTGELFHHSYALSFKLVSEKLADGKTSPSGWNLPRCKGIQSLYLFLKSSVKKKLPEKSIKKVLAKPSSRKLLAAKAPQVLNEQQELILMKPIFISASFNNENPVSLLKISDPQLCWFYHRLETESKSYVSSLTFYIDYGILSASIPRGALDGKKTTLLQLTELFTSQSQCDVTFFFPERQVELKAHRAILVARSPVFARMFHHSGMEEASTGRVDIEDVEPIVFKQLLHYLYSGEAPELDDEDITTPLYVTADRYGVEDLKEECGNLLAKWLSAENAVSILILADLCSDHALLKTALSFTAERSKEISASAEWKKLHKHHSDLFFRVVQLIVAKLPDTTK